MAQLVLGAAGAVVGGMFGMPQVGWAIGSALGGMLFAPDQPDQYGPRQTDTKVQMSTVGQAIPVVFGRVRIAGNVIDGSEVREHEHVEDIGGGKGGGPQSHTFTSEADVAIGICEGEIAGIGRIWQDYKLVHDGSAKTIDGIAGSSIKAAGMRIYLGTEDQLPDPTLQALHGDLCPAYRGLAYIVFDGLDLTGNGGRVPNFEFEVFRTAQTGGPRVINATNLKIEQLGADQGHALYYAPTGGGGSIGTIWDNVLGISSHSGGILRVQAVNYVGGGIPEGYGVLGNPTDPRSKRTYAIDYNGNIKSNEPLSGSDVMMSSRVDNSGETTKYFQFVAVLRGDASRPAQTLALNTKSTRVMGTEGLGLALFGTGDVSSPVSLTGAGAETGRDMAGIFVSQDGYSLYMFTAPNGGAPVDRWLKLQFTAARTLAVVEQGGCDYNGNDTFTPIPRNLIVGTGASPYFNGTTTGMMENDGEHLWTCSGGQVNLFAIEAGKLRFKTSLYRDWGPTFGGSPAIYVENGVAYTVSPRTIAQFTRIGTLDAESVTLGEIVSDISVRCGLAPAEIDVGELTDKVDGFVVGARMAGRAAISPLQTGFFFDAVESEGKLRFKKRGSVSALLIPEDDLAAHAGDAGSESQDTVELTRMQEVELPSETVVTYFSLEGDYAAGSQRGQRQTTESVNTVGVNLAIVMGDAKAKQVAVVNNLAPWVNRNPVSFSTTRKYIHVEPCDVVTVVKDGQPLVVRITNRTEGGDGVIAFQGVMEDPEIYSQSATPSRTLATTQTLAVPSSTYLQPLDIPALTDAYADGPVLLFAGDGYTEAWKGAGLFSSMDGGATYADTGKGFAPGAVMGFAITALPAPTTIATFDETSFVDARLTDLADTLSSSSESAVLSGANAALVGDEIIQFKNAMQIGPGQFRLSGLLRARRGTEWAAGSHAAGERFVLLSASALRQLNMSPSLIGKEIAYKAPTFSATVASARAVSLTYKAENMRPLAPVYGLAYRDVSPADWHFQWIRRSRAGGEWRDNVDAPLGESGEKYDVEIYSNASYSTLKRTISDLTSAQAIYTAAQQAADFGSAQASVFVKVYQKSELVGRSRALAFKGDWLAPAAPTPAPAPEETGPGAGGASYDFILRMSGPNGSTTFVDEGTRSAAVTAVGSVSQDGAGSAVFSGGHVKTSDPGLINIPNTDMCMQGHFTTTGTNDFIAIATKNNPGFFGGSWFVGLSGSSGRLVIYWEAYAGGSAFLTSNVIGLNNGLKHHWAWTRSGSTHTLWVDGTAVASQNVGTNFTSSPDPIVIGEDVNFGSRTFSGKMDDFAMTFGSAVYTAPFTPPALL